jgi:predicted nucleotide-binding protein (sugar kinase/HSP70/actin superfamily)
LRPNLRRLLNDRSLKEVQVITFSENKLKNTISKLRVELCLAAGVALVATDQLVEIDDEP